MPGEPVVYEEAEGGEGGRPPVFPSGAGGLVSTVDDCLSFGRMLLDRGMHENERIPSSSSVEAMTTDQLTPEQEAASDFFPAWGVARGWGPGVAVHTQAERGGRNTGTTGW